MRILMVNKYLYPRAGAETYMITVAEALMTQGHEVSFFGMDHPENTQIGETATIPFLEFGGAISASARVGNLFKATGSALRSSASQALDAWVEKWKPDLIHAHNIYNQLPPSLFKNAAKRVPVMMTLHDYKPVCPNYSVFVNGEPCTRCVGGSVMPCVTQRCCHGSLAKSLISAASSSHHRRRGTYQKDYHYYVSPSHFVRDRMIDGGFDPTTVEVINNFAVIPEAATPPGDGLFYGGRLCVEKGVDVLLRGLALLTKPHPVLRIAGDGPTADELRELATSLELDSVTWLGRIKPEQVVQELHNCAIACVPSTWHENCSMAIMEALAQGRPVLASDRGGNPDLVRPGIDGEVFKGNDPQSLADKLQNLLDPSQLASRGVAAREAAMARFSPEVHVKQLLSAFEKTQAAFDNTHVSRAARAESHSQG